ncbi:MAG: hypothetical protein AAFY56_10445, partial [Pseudomonadota bacterium]
PSRAFIAGAVWLAAGLLLIGRGLFPYWLDVARDSYVNASLLLVAVTLVGAAMKAREGASNSIVGKRRRTAGCAQ